MVLGRGSAQFRVVRLGGHEVRKARLRLFRWYLSLWPFLWHPVALAWSRPGVPLLSDLAGPIQHFRAGVAAGLCGRAGFRRGPLLDFHGSLQLLDSSRVRERDKAPASQPGFCGAPDGGEHLFWECLVEIRESPEFLDLMREDKAHWPRCLLWHGWLPMLSGTNRGSPWAADAFEAAGYMVETALGRYSSDLLCGWSLSDGCDEVQVASSLPDHPNVWTDGSLVFGPCYWCFCFWYWVLFLLLKIAGVVTGGVILMMFVLMVLSVLAGVSALFLGLCRLFNVLRCGVLF